MKPHPNAGKTCACRRGKASAYDGRCGHCRSQRERKAVQKMRDGWPREAAERGYRRDEDKTWMMFDEVKD